VVCAKPEMVGSFCHPENLASNSLEGESKKMKLLITGASGLFGSKLAQIAHKQDTQVYCGYNQTKQQLGYPIQFDVSNLDQVEDAFKKTKPDVVVHAASLTNVDLCETNKKLAWKTNIVGTQNIIQQAKKNNTHVIYISTDYVFNGKTGNYTETDIPDPINYYGLTKLEAEYHIHTLKNYTIARPSVIFGSTPASGKTNFVLWTINMLKNNQKIKAATNQTTNPTLNTNLANMILEIAKRKIKGVIHTSGATPISRYDLAIKIAKTFDLNQDLIEKTSIEAFNFPAKRPQNSSLNTKKAQRTLKNKPLTIHRALSQLKKQLNQT
jgi:dTDP-4-dehydrorhamnose reductase